MNFVELNVSLGVDAYTKRNCIRGWMEAYSVTGKTRVPDHQTAATDGNIG